MVWPQQTHIVTLVYKILLTKRFRDHPLGTPSIILGASCLLFNSNKTILTSSLACNFIPMCCDTQLISNKFGINFHIITEYKNTKQHPKNADNTIPYRLLATFSHNIMADWIYGLQPLPNIKTGCFTAYLKSGKRSNFKGWLLLNTNGFVLSQSWKTVK